jgi:hypothetical protein
MTDEKRAVVQPSTQLNASRAAVARTREPLNPEALSLEERLLMIEYPLEPFQRFVIGDPQPFGHSGRKYGKNPGGSGTANLFFVNNSAFN